MRNIPYPKLLLALLCAGTVPATLAASATTLPEVLVEDTALADPAQREFPLADFTGTAADGGAWLRSVTGVSGVRMGGHGIDPVIRGLAQTRINILLAGAYVHGGCPNRMDPPTAYTDLDSYDAVTVLKGVQTLQYGAGGGAGTVLFTRETPRFVVDESLRGKAGLQFQSNPNTRGGFADLAAGTSQGYARLIASGKEADDYRDGDGVEVRSGFSSKDANLLLGFTPDADTRLELGLEANRTDDVLYAGAGMDAPQSDNDTVRLKFKRNAAIGPFAAVNAELYRSDVTHVMDNYSLRPQTAPMKMRVPSTSLTTGGRLSVDLAAASGWLWTLGLDRQANSREALRYSGMMTANMLDALLWPDVDIAQTGLSGELLIDLDARNRFKGGLRYDRVDSSADRAAETPPAIGAPSPNALYTLYYGATAQDRTEDNLGGLLRFEHDLTDTPMTVYTGISRSVRSADATEGYMASNAIAASQRWVGNPTLDPEIHHQFDVGLNWRTGDWDAGGDLFYNRVSDFILRDLAHGQTGILLSDNATIYRNVDATLYGLELEVTRRWTRVWESRATLAYVHAENTTDSRAIAQIPPLEVSLALDYLQDSWSGGAELRGAARQTRVDSDPVTGSGLDVRETPGFAVLNLYGKARLGKQAEMKLGIDNVFARRYAEHLNKANAFDVTQVQVNEPGRSLWVKAEVKF